MDHAVERVLHKTALEGNTISEVRANETITTLTCRSVIIQNLEARTLQRNIIRVLVDRFSAALADVADDSDVPSDALLREFLGGSKYDVH